MTLDLETTLLLSSIVQTVVAIIVVLAGGSGHSYPGLLQWKLSLSLAAMVSVLGAWLFLAAATPGLADLLLLLVIPLQIDGLLQFLSENNQRGWRALNIGAAIVFLAIAGVAERFDMHAALLPAITAAEVAIEAAIGIAVLLRFARASTPPALQVMGACFALDFLLSGTKCTGYAAAVAAPATVVDESFLAAITMIGTVILLLKAFTMVVAMNQRTEAELRLLSRDLEYQASTDALTRLRNRRSFYEQGHATVALALRHDRPLTALMIDVDRFKEINDKHGHAAGDRALVAVAETMTRMLRTSDLIGRVGGEEFAILLVETTQRSAELTAERLRRGIAALRPSCAAFHDLSISIGLAPLAAEATGLDTLLHHADEALYRAKREGRDRWVAAA